MQLRIRIILTITAGLVISALASVWHMGVEMRHELQTTI